MIIDALLIKAILQRFADNAVVGGTLEGVRGLFKDVAPAKERPYAVIHQLPGLGPQYTFKDQDGNVLVIEPWALQVTVVTSSSDDAWRIIGAIDDIFNLKAFVVSGVRIPVRRQDTIVVFEQPAQAPSGVPIYQAVATYLFEFDKLVAAT